MLPNVKAVLDRLIKEFADGSKIPEAIAYASFPIPNIPSSTWSLLNQLIMYFSGTKDARGYNQWKKVNRFVKKGAKAFSILVPKFEKVDDPESKEEKTILSGFMCGFVFRYEDTNGEPLDYEQIELPRLPLLERAEELGVSVTAVGGSEQYFGYYKPEEKVIALATPEEKTFFHELSHVAHEKVLGSLKRGQDPLQEIVAELSAQALCRIVGKDGNSTMGNSYRYIESYAKKLNISPYQAILRVISDVEKVLSLILKKDEATENQPVEEVKF